MIRDYSGRMQPWARRSWPSGDFARPKPRPAAASTGSPGGHELRSNVLAQLRRCERLIALQDRLPAILEGKDKPADASEAFEFAELCGIEGQEVAAARLYGEALDATPRQGRRRPRPAPLSSRVRRRTGRLR